MQQGGINFQISAARNRSADHQKDGRDTAATATPWRRWKKPLLVVPRSLGAPAFGGWGSRWPVASTSPFASPSVSSSAALIVCKAWLRVATPLLYHVVVVRSKAQARALQRSLRGNPDLGRFVKMLRVEGGFGPAMEDILRNTPNITDIFLSLQIHASDSTTGLVGGLQYINPTRMIIFDDGHMKNYLKNKHVQGLLRALEARARKWTNFPRRCNISLCRFPRIRGFFPSFSWGHLGLTSSREIMLHKDEPVSLQPSESSFKPMASAPQEVIERVWSRSLEFAMLSSDAEPEVASDGSSDCPSEAGVYHDRLQLLFVSKMFHRLATPHMYCHLAFPHAPPLRSLALQLASTPAVGAHIRSIEVRWDMFEGNVDMTDILCHTPRLVRLVGFKGLFSGIPTLSWTAFEALGQAAGASLQTFSGFKFKVTEDSEPHSPAVFGRFAALRRLDWNIDYPLVVNERPFFDQAAAVPRDDLPALESLRITSWAGLELFIVMELPSLRRVDFDFKYHHDQIRGDPTFLQKHGPKLEEIKILTPQFPGTSILTLCPGMSILSCEVFAQHGNDFGYEHLAPGFQHACLTTLVVDKEALSNKVKDQQHWKLFFDKLNLAYFPSLSEIRVVPLTEWPTTEHAISKSVWVKLAENLLLSGIQLTTVSDVHMRFDDYLLMIASNPPLNLLCGSTCMSFPISSHPIIGRVNTPVFALKALIEVSKIVKPY
ncbi:hypothetical protein DFH06DRAFT_1308863 [Mycena polygramma]|nr:hypothetical protein DFH06DRAFT_1308863 [Mycena polygramma]